MPEPPFKFELDPASTSARERDVLLRAERERTEQAERRRETRNTLVQVLTIIVGLMAAAFAGYQGYESHELRKATERQIDKAQDQFDLQRQDAAKATNAAQQETERSLALQTKQGGIAADNAKRAAIAADRSASVAEKALRYGERAYVGVTHAELAEPLKPGDSFRLSAIISNTGRTPADGTLVSVVSGLSPTLSSFLKEAKARVEAGPPAVYSRTVLYPAQSFRPNHQSSFTLTEERLNFIKQGELTLYIYVHITYKDVFGEMHMTETCVYFDKRTERELDPCSDGNAAK